MESFNLKVINLYRIFKDLMLYLFNNNIFSVNRNKDIAGAKLTCSSPTLLRHVKRMLICANDLITVYINVNKFISFIYKCLQYFFQRSFPGFGICCVNIIAYTYCFDCNFSEYG